MDRVTVQVGAIPLDSDILSTNRNALVGIGLLALSVLGTGSPTVVNGLACAPGAGLNASVGPGSIYTLTAVDATQYGSLPADTSDNIVQQGIVTGQTLFSCPAPGTVGQSINYLIEAQYQQVDQNAVALQYYSSSNPLQPYVGSATATKRAAVCALQLKAGTAAATGSQVTPTVDSGWTALWVVQVNYGQSSIPGGQITAATNAPFLAGLLNSHHGGVPGQAPKINLASEVQGVLPYANLPSGVPIWCGTATGTANAPILTPSPSLGTLTAGQGIAWESGASANTGAVSLTVSGISYPLLKVGETGPTALTGTEIQPNSVYTARLDNLGNLELTTTELGTASLKNMGNTVKDPGTGSLEVFSPMGAAITGANYTFLATDQGKTRVRSNSGSAMTDTLPAVSAIADGWTVGVFNSDSFGIETIQVPSGANLNGVLNGALTLNPGQAAKIGFDGANFWVTTMPVSSLTAAQSAYLTFANNGQTISPGAYEVDSSGGSFTIYLKLSPSAGDNYAFTNSAGNLSSAPVTLNGNGKTIEGTSTFVLDVSFEASRFANISSNWSLS